MSLRSRYIHKVQPGDTIVSISKKYGVRLADIIKSNPHIKNLVQLSPGEEIYIPLKGASQAVDKVFQVQLPDGYRIQKFVEDLNFPTGITFNNIGEMFVVESGYRSGAAQGSARVLKVNPDGSTSLIVEGFSAPVTSISWHMGYLYIGESGYPGQISRIASNGTRETIVKGLPTGGDYGLGEIVFGSDGLMYFSVGAATNSGVVGPDNKWLLKRPRFHDLTCRNNELAGQNFVSENPLTPEPGDTAQTGAFHPFNVSSKSNEIVQRNFPCSGAIYTANPDGTGLRVFADGFRAPFGLGFGPGGNLFATDNGMDNRGSRPVFNAYDTFEEVHFGEWYGWPDYNARIPLTDARFRPSDGSQPEFLIKNHPPLAEAPAAVFQPHSTPIKFDFSINEEFGFMGEAFVALFGQLYHHGEPLPEPAGFKVVRVNPIKGDVNDFMVILNPGTDHQGPIHPIQAKFSPNGTELFILDFGHHGEHGRQPKRNSGAIWRITR